MSAIVVDPFGVRDDAVLTSLGRALDPDEMERHLNRLSGLSRVTAPLRLARIAVRRYKPERRCLIEYVVEPRRDRGDGEVLRLIGKVRRHRSGASAYQRLLDFRHAGFADDSPDGIAVPEPIGVIPALGLSLQRWVPGRPATDLLGGPDGFTLAPRIAEAAHKVHQAGVATRGRHTLEDELRILAERLPAVADEQPRWRRRIEGVLETCGRLARSVPDVAPCGIHRDFYADQVLVDGAQLHLIDFDLYCAGDPALDVGNFMGHLREQAVRVHGDPEALAPVEQALEDRFVELAGEAVRAAVRAYAVLTLVRHIHLSTVLPARRSSTGRVLECAEEALLHHAR